MTIRLDDLKPADPAAAKPAGTIRVIVKVSKPNYVPVLAQLRARIDEHLFTADVQAARLADLEKDPDVVSVSNRKLRIVE